MKNFHPSLEEMKLADFSQASFPQKPLQIWRIEVSVRATLNPKDEPFTEVRISLFGSKTDQSKCRQTSKPGRMLKKMRASCTDNLNIENLPDELRTRFQCVAWAYKSRKNPAGGPGGGGVGDEKLEQKVYTNV
jgi:hypothetical protein